MILILIFAEVLGEFSPFSVTFFDDILINSLFPTGLYGLIVALLMNSRSRIDATCDS